MSNKEDLVKSIDALIDEIFAEDVVEKGSPLDLAQDSSTKADEEVNKAPKAQKDEARGAGRPKQISDVPQTDQDGRRESSYDDSITENEEKESEPDEAKKQSESMDQTQDKKRLAFKPKAPAQAPFKKSQEVTDEEWKEFQEFKKSKVEAAKKAAQQEELRKAEETKKEQEELIKSAVRDATSEIRKENEELRKSFQESQELLKAIAQTPRQAKSITSVQAIEKSSSPNESESESFSKSDILDAAFELAKSGRIKDDVVSEIEMTGRCYDTESRKEIEKYLTQGR